MIATGDWFRHFFDNTYLEIIKAQRAEALTNWTAVKTHSSLVDRLSLYAVRI